MFSEKLGIRTINRLVHSQREKNHLLEIEVLLPFKYPSYRVNWKSSPHRLSGNRMVSWGRIETTSI